MLQRILFCKRRGGAFLLLLFFTSTLVAQNPLNPDCGWVIEACEGSQPPGGGCMDGTACSPVYYYFYLSRNGGVGGTPYTFKFRHFNFSGQLNITSTAGIGGTAKRFSSLNLVESLACSPPDINQSSNPSSPILGVAADGTFAYEVVNASEMDITWTFTGKKLLFVLAIDAFPGEIITPGNFSWTYSLPNGINCINSPVVTCNPMGLSGKSVSVPTTCASPFQLKFGSPVDDPIPGYPKRKRVPVFVSSNSATPTQFDITELDFLLKIATVDPMAGISIGTGLLPASDILLYVEPPGNSSTNQRIYVKTSGLVLTTTNSGIPNSNNTLFSILLDGPELESDCATVDISFTNFRRMFLAGTNTCCQPRIGDLLTSVQWAPTPCPGTCPKASLSVVEATINLPPALTCEDLFLDVFISTVPAVEYDEAIISLLIKHSGAGNLQWNDDMAYSNSSYCSSLPDFVTATAVGPGLLRIDFSIDGTTNINLTATSTNQLVRLAFKGNNACIESVAFADAVLHVKDASGYCLPLTSSEILENENDDDLCGDEKLIMKYTTYFEDNMQELDYATSVISGGPQCVRTGTTTGVGSEAICPCLAPGEIQRLTPSKIDNPLNGLTTFDLVLISKQILGIEPLGSPYRLIAADANRSNSITTLDIVELRKLLLGIYLVLPNAPSYRFVEKSYVFPNPLNPFQPGFPEFADFTIPPNEVTKEFYGIKIGDVNETVVSSRPTANGETLSHQIGYGVIGGKMGAVIEVPIFMKENMKAVAWQNALSYNTSHLKLLDVMWTSPLGEFQEHAWYEPNPGKINVLWYDGEGSETQIPTGTPLFILKFELLADLPNVALGLSERSIQNVAYSKEGQSAEFQLVAAPMQECLQRQDILKVSPETLWSASVYPNPTSGQFRMEVSVPEESNGVITLFDLLGQKRWRYSTILNAGYNSIASNQMPILHSGQYFVHFETPFGKKILRFVKN
jgi:hypothetical protein